MKTMYRSLHPRAARQQRGAVLVVALVLLIVLTLLGISSMDTTVLEHRLAKNNDEKNYAFQAAEAGLLESRAVYNSTTQATVLTTAWSLVLPGNITMSRKIDAQVSRTLPNSTVLEYKGDFGIPRGVDWGAGATRAKYFETRTTGANLETDAVRANLRSGIRQLTPAADY